MSVFSCILFYITNCLVTFVGIFVMGVVFNPVTVLGTRGTCREELQWKGKYLSDRTESTVSEGKKRI